MIANGDLLDPAQKLRGRRDIGIKYGQIALVAPSSAPTALQRYDASGRLVTPGLVDLHTHYGPLVSGIGLPADELVPISATTTAVSAGDAGANTFGALKQVAIDPSRRRDYAFVHISAIGLAGGLAVPEMLNIDYAQVEACARTLVENPDTVLGVKVRITDSVVGQNGLEPLRRAIAAARRSCSSALAPIPARTGWLWPCARLDVSSVRCSYSIGWSCRGSDGRPRRS